MVVKVKIARSTGRHPLAITALLIVGSAIALCAIIGFSIFGYYYFAYRSVVDQRLSQPVFEDTAKIYAAPREVRPGQKISVQLIADELRQAGYTTDGAAQPSPLGTYSQGVQKITVRPGPQSYHAPDPAVIHVSAGVVDSVTDAKGQPLASYELEPLLITGLSSERGPHQAPAAHLQRNSAQPRPCGRGYRGPPVL